MNSRMTLTTSFNFTDFEDNNVAYRKAFEHLVTCKEPSDRTYRFTETNKIQKLELDWLSEEKFKVEYISILNNSKKDAYLFSPGNSVDSPEDLKREQATTYFPSGTSGGIFIGHKKEFHYYLGILDELEEGESEEIHKVRVILVANSVEE